MTPSMAIVALLTPALSASGAVLALSRTALPRAAVAMSSMLHVPPCDDPRKLPGDPTLMLTTNVQLKDKAAFAKAASKAVVAATGKPESYVAVCVTDGAALIWGGDDSPAAVGCLYSIGAISMKNNGALMAALSQLMEAEGVPANRIYVNFFDMPRENVGWNGATFAG